jgi:hypothetical protein
MYRKRKKNNWGLGFDLRKKREREIDKRERE